MTEFAVEVAGGTIVGWESGDGERALVLHGGPLISDYTAPLAEQLDGLRTIRYQQRGLPPSTTAGPFDVEANVADALAVLDARGVARAWAIAIGVPNWVDGTTSIRRGFRALRGRRRPSGLRPSIV